MASKAAPSFFRQHFLLIVVLLFVVLLGAAYVLGYRTGPGLTFVRVGMLSVDGLPDGANVYTDQASRGVARGGSLTAALVPGSHSVIVDVANDEPWEKTVTISSNATTHVSPILVPKKPIAVPLTGSGAAAAVAAAAKQTLPSQAAPLIMGCAQVYVESNRVIADTATSTPHCTPPEFLCVGGSCEATVVFAPVNILSSVVPFPGRTDAIIVSAGTDSYVLGLDPRTPQFFAPFIRDLAPIIVPAGTSSVDVVDSGRAYSVSF